MIREEGEEQERERWTAWERRRCACVLPNADSCIHDRYGYAVNEGELPAPRCECHCHAILQSDDDRDWE